MGIMLNLIAFICYLSACVCLTLASPASAAAEEHAYTYDGRQWIVVSGDVGGGGGPKKTTAATITLTYGGGKTLDIQGPQDEAFCVARREALMLHADRIRIPAGTYPASCEGTQTSWAAPRITLTPNIYTEPLDIEPPK